VIEPRKIYIKDFSGVFVYFVTGRRKRLTAHMFLRRYRKVAVMFAWYWWSTQFRKPYLRVP